MQHDHLTDFVLRSSLQIDSRLKSRKITKNIDNGNGEYLFV